MENSSNNLNIPYPYMPKDREFLYVGLENSYMKIAKEVAMTSNEKQQPTGVVIVANNEVIAKASNKNPLTSENLIKLHKKFCIRHSLCVKSGKMYWLCPGCAGKESHAESRAIKQLEKTGLPTGSVDVYLWGHWWCCDVCWKNMFKLPELRNVYLLQDSHILFNPKVTGNIIGKNA